MQQRLDAGYARYEIIAIDLAQKIARGEYRVGQKLSGRSLLAGTYNVSPETIRRSIALLQNIGVVESITGSGIIIKSSALAKQYIVEYNERQEILNMRSRINGLLEKRRSLDTALEKELSKLLEHYFQKSSVLQQIDDVIIPAESWMVGKSIAETNMRSATGATVVAVNRKEEEFFSPSPEMILKENDVLIIVGTTQAKEKAKEAVKSSTPMF